LLSAENKKARENTQHILTARFFSFPVDFDNFQRVLNRPGGFRDPGEPEEYCRGFQVFDKELTGFIGVGQFRYILTNLGEKMSDEEVDELLKAVDTSSGELNYMGEFVADVFLSQRRRNEY
jgi:Ca2+-binding EF-hand superfamily protein